MEEPHYKRIIKRSIYHNKCSSNKKYVHMLGWQENLIIKGVSRKNQEFKSLDK
jgi:hypothetical protein